ncbi:unnamed protein product [Nesidiocoris tenuis]|uniref:Tyrosine-protein kinase n=1 Tax=Nesidiocoris tenuis TaxID=355587 RepID=A0A6H5GGS1_9HEMI|nr:unnamed protein product [Nesidiocoris tenuis]
MACNNEDEEVVKQGLMVKRSQNKKRFSPVNYKSRWFVLTKKHLVYYDTEGEKRKEKGRISLKSIKFVELASQQDISVESSVQQSGLPLQIGYAESGQEYVLLVLSNDSQDRDDWINALRSLCTQNDVSSTFHNGLWNGKRWSCCRASTRASVGCTSTTTWPSTNVLQEPVTKFDRRNDTRFLRANFDVLSFQISEPMTRPKIVVALYPFKAIEGGDLSLEKGAEYEVIDDAQEHWWKVKDCHGAVGYIPSNYVKEKELVGLQKYEWYVGDMSRQRAESLLKQEEKEGCFVVRNSSTKGLYTLSLYTRVPHPHVKHYHIKQNSRGDFFLSEKHCCVSIPELINYHRHNSGGLASRLKASPCDRPVPPTAGLSHDKWEIDPAELLLMEELGSGQFGVVRRGKWRGCIDTAVKMMKEGTMSEDDFIEEAKVMTKLQHSNLVQLYGVCSKHRPIYIVTEYMKHGSLLNYLRRHENTLGGNIDLLLDMCIQTFLSELIELFLIIFRYVLDDQYTSSGGTKFPIKWAPPEVLNYTRFSSKSDVWAYGVLMWEVFTCGKMPYGRLKNTEVVERVQRGIILERPKACLKEVYDIMRQCWAHCPEDRPSFRTLKEQLTVVGQSIAD